MTAEHAEANVGRFVSFLIKVWVSEELEEAAAREELDEGAMRQAWRGQIQHVRSGSQMPFASHREMLEFVRGHLVADDDRIEEDMPDAARGASSEGTPTGR